RPRPEFSIEKTIVVFDRRGTYSFPSGHTALAFAAAYILAKEHKKWSRWYYLLAFLIAFSRIYLGKHYPSDVLFGIIIGISIGYLSLILSTKFKALNLK
ncbi:phosphatase PAP2 family protein, partial [Candidatus Gottesmanbacteria bacterium]|nr:phosphatase PAP2 family protein [Candidatus Gottesmanbacteria bacterium]